MALSDLSFKLHDDAALTTPSAAILSFSHKSDLSDNPQDRLKYFGSAESGRQLQENSNPGVNNITITPVDTLGEWAGSTAYTLGFTGEPTVDNTYRYVVTTPGTSGASEPIWPTSIGSTVTDGTVVWECVAKSHQPTEIKLALTAAGLDTATAGAALSLGPTLLSGTANKVEIHIRVTNAVTTTSSNAGYPEIGLDINEVIETAV